MAEGNAQGRDERIDAEEEMARRARASAPALERRDVELLESLVAAGAMTQEKLDEYLTGRGKEREGARDQLDDHPAEEAGTLHGEGARQAHDAQAMYIQQGDAEKTAEREAPQPGLMPDFVDHKLREAGWDPVSGQAAQPGRQFGVKEVRVGDRIVGETTSDARNPVSSDGVDALEFNVNEDDVSAMRAAGSEKWEEQGKQGPVWEKVDSQIARAEAASRAEAEQARQHDMDFQRPDQSR